MRILQDALGDGSSNEASGDATGPHAESDVGEALGDSVLAASIADGGLELGCSGTTSSCSQHAFSTALTTSKHVSFVEPPKKPRLPRKSIYPQVRSVNEMNASGFVTDPPGMLGQIVHVEHSA